ncbi:CRISPR-associated endoribonuclease Cas6 [Rhodohalobacter sp. 614A]|uniref:CRISPR-associated endoribonuclease Cas6 n=1 Tax=Rhodohalobacter sp. 614A TaxID=2908649 RepID=UPI001F3A30B5|nr:CRISPR-associated endoribonuclease Cas6 [Rhodohalobacter sp. 614A]
MRLHLTLTPNTEPVPFNYQHPLTGALHKWLGQNDLHDKISLYSFSWLRGQAERVDGKLNFPNGARWFISFWESKYGSDLIQGIVDKPDVFYGMKVDEVQVAKTPSFNNEQRFKVASPVLVRKNLDAETRKHLTYKDDDVDEFLSRTLNKKLSEAGLENSFKPLKVTFDKTYPNPKTKLVNLKGTQLRANYCPVIVKGDPKAIEFAWTVGVGELTGSGFGALS